MSDFECTNGHWPAPHELVCGRCYCGAMVMMDGMYAREHRGMDEEWDREVEKKNQEEEPEDEG